MYNEVMAVRQRLFHIDLLRAISIFGVMAVHALALFLGSSVHNTIWNYLEFVVIAFVGCSGYVTWLSFQKEDTRVQFTSWYPKRFVRLYYPYIAYVASYAALAYVFPGFIKGRLITFSASFFTSSLFLSGGADVGWLVTLFVELALLTPVFIWIMKEAGRIYVFIGLLGLLTLVMVFLPVSAEYSRVIAWVPWSFVYLVGMLYAKSETNKSFRIGILFIAGAIAAIIWVALRLALIERGSVLTFTLHKYPPDLFYLSYGLAVSAALLWMIKQSEQKLMFTAPFITFISRTSYGMFFIQLIVLDFLTTTFKNLSVVPVMASSMVFTIGIAWMWGRVRGQRP